MPRSPRLKGLQDIRTSSGRRTPRAASTAEALAPGSALRQLQQALHRINVRAGATAPSELPTRAWAFVPKPQFARYKRELLVERLEEPHVELHDERSSVVVLAHLPGASLAELRIVVHGDVLSLQTEPSVQSSKRYEAEVLLPFIVAPEPTRCAFRNGILELSFARTDATQRETRKRPQGGGQTC